MDLQISQNPKLSRIKHLFVYLLEDQKPQLESYPAEVAALVTETAKRAHFVGRSDAGITVLNSEGPAKVTLIGLGKAATLSIRQAKAALYGAGKIARRNRDTSIGILFPFTLPGLSAGETLRLASELLIQADYRYDTYVTVREEEKPAPIHCVLFAPSTLESREVKRLSVEAEAVAAGIRTVRDLGNGPGNEVTATRLANRAAEVSKELGIRCTIYDKKQIVKMKMGGLLAVNRASAEEPRFVVMEYTPKKKARKTVCLVGKGITFDSGGISIKPAEKMEEMKFDMCGAAAVIGTLEAAARMELPVHLFGVIASTDNLPGGNAYKPGDIVTTMSGKTIEVVNTDAEGRVILADALHYASTLKPDCILDFATLTGACVVALGYEASGLFTSDDELARKLIQAGEKAGERLWRLPEWDDYKEQIRSDWADVKNSGGRWAGATTAAVFLKQFVNSVSWAHIDIAGTAWSEHETAREAKGATGVGVRMTIEFLKSME